MYSARTDTLRQRLIESAMDLAVITDEDSIYYYTGYFDYLHMEFGRPTLLLISARSESLLITPALDFNSATALACVDRIEPWNDGIGDEWREHLPSAFKNANVVGLELKLIAPLVRDFIDSLLACKPNKTQVVDVSPMVSAMRMIKSEEELQMARHAGAVANAMMAAGRAAISAGVAEFEVALATTEAGTRKSAELLEQFYGTTDMSPNIHFLQIMASGKEVIKTHHRATNRIMRRGEPVFLCFCGMTNFHRFKLGFDRTFWIEEMSDQSQEKVYQVAVDSQAAALAVLAPGVLAEDVHAAYAEVIRSAGYEYPFRCGRGTGFSFLEPPQLVSGDKTRLQPGMVFAVDGSVSTPTFRAQVGDSFIITQNGYEAVTDHPKSLEQVILR